MGNLYDVEQARVSFSKLDPADVCAVQPTSIGKFLLGEADLEPS